MTPSSRRTTAKLEPVPNGREAADGTGTVHRVVKMLGAITASEGDVGVGELAQRVGLPIPTIHRLLHLLRKEGMVNWHPTDHKYSVGPELYRIAAVVSSSMTMPNLAQPELDALSRETGETVLLGMYQPGTASMSFAARAEGSDPLQYRIQMHVPLSLVWGASGKAILAYLPDEVVDRALTSEQRNAQNGKAPPSIDQLGADLERVRKNGFAVSEGEKLLGARGIAAPVFDHHGIVGCVCVTSPKERIPIDRISEFGAAVSAAAHRLSYSLGSPAPPLNRRT